MNPDQFKHDPPTVLNAAYAQVIQLNGSIQLNVSIHVVKSGFNQQRLICEWRYTTHNSKTYFVNIKVGGQMNLARLAPEPLPPLYQFKHDGSTGRTEIKPLFERATNLTDVSRLSGKRGLNFNQPNSVLLVYPQSVQVSNSKSFVGSTLQKSWKLIAVWLIGLTVLILAIIYNRLWAFLIAIGIYIMTLSLTIQSGVKIVAGLVILGITLVIIGASIGLATD